VKRTSWITWRIYFFTLPINIFVLVFAADHSLNSWNDVFMWGLIAFISHLCLIPFVAVGVLQSQQWRSWKFDLAFLFLLGATRGVVINYCVEMWDLTQTVSYCYKVFNSTVALPQWFVGVAILFESKRDYERTFRELFARAMRKEQETHERRDMLPAGNSNVDETIARLQFITSNLAADIQQLLNRPKLLSDYTIEANRIQELIDKDLRPTSAELWRANKVNTPKIPLKTLLSISLLENRLRVPFVVLISVPYLFVGLNGALGLKIALAQCLFVLSYDLLVYALAEALHKFKITSRAISNLIILVSGFIFPCLIQIYFLPTEFKTSNAFIDLFLYHNVLTVTFIALLLTVNGYNLVKSQREEVLASLESHILGEKYNAPLSHGGDAQHKSDLANYLHGEIQAGLTASSLLLQQAAKSGDSDLAQEALERATGLLNQDLTNITFTRMAAPALKIQKITDAWKGIADISVALPPFEQLGETTLRSLVQLIEEAVANSIRHAQATDIKISGVLKNNVLTISIISNGNPMAKGRAGLGTKMFNELTEEWNYSSESGHNRLTLTLINSI
jgi:signal transduction histidine kinase